ncbi:hypothetical protein [Kutzneria buriramensis]|uniref:hypothetical protein n=1 Tax=Kutzneria buriramensis TaxID=1045776 RepID=UPI000E26E36F|nr:hypothetical protein [Kutzneria buriramensis]
MPWCTDFFTELANTFWRAAVPPAQTAAEIDFILDATGVRPGARVLDAGRQRPAQLLRRR